ncbi:Alpha/beta hydrolase family protein [Geodermatophilus sp. DSM 45219]|nr:Alpha/beta hydrolase family protein [Geodermatophilus sp. DSM 45219]
MSPVPAGGQQDVRATFVLVPGAGGRAWYWHRLVPELERRGCAAVAVDLPAGDDAAGLGRYADAVAVATAGSARPLVVVGQSMGGLTAPLVCDRVPVDLLVLLNAMVPLPGETGAEWWTATGHEQARAEAARAHGWPLDDDDAFTHDVPPEVLAGAPAPFAQSGTPFTEPWPLPGWPDVPTRVLAGRDDRFFPVDFQRRVAGERLGLPVGELPGGHLVALSRPAELAGTLVGLLAGVRLDRL